jgi:hypothetical protein
LMFYFSWIFFTKKRQDLLLKDIQLIPRIFYHWIHIE